MAETIIITYTEKSVQRRAKL